MHVPRIVTYTVKKRMEHKGDKVAILECLPEGISNLIKKVSQ